MSLADYLPHGSEIVLIDEILEFQTGYIKTKSVLNKRNKFLKDGKFATHKSIEMMAQALGVYDSKMRELKGLKSGFGFLLGSRKFEIFKPFLNEGEEIFIKAACSIQDESGFGVYDCELYAGKELAARATLNVLSPEDEFVQRMFNEQK
ncbi:ApeP family dehydratase [Campylobacter sp.]|uniref:ApeP family dehydratase n=1 Tax=Campylobacter sp. TaxID=205 RepID=UPI0026FBBB88|nr:thioester dehydrase [Campylobacter sp.]